MSELRARELDDGNLEAKADAEEGLLVLPREACRGDLALNAAVAKAARHEDAISLLEGLPRGGIRGAGAALDEVRGVDPLDDELALGVEGSVVQRLDDGEVRVGELRILADDGDVHLERERVDQLGERHPVVEEGLVRLGHEVEPAQQVVGDALVVEQQRHAVDVGDVVHADALLRRHVAEVGELLLGRGAQRLARAADEEVGHQADGAQLLHRVLRGLGLLLAHRAEHRHEGHVEEADVLALDAELELPQRLDERHALDVTHRAAELDDAHVGRSVVSVGGDMSDALDPVLDGVGHVRHHLHRLAQVVPLALLLEALLVDLAGGDVVVSREGDVVEALVIAEVEVGLAAVVEHEDLAVLERAHRACVDVQVRVDLDRRHAVARGLEQHS
mmetsp:Transcript_80334/g.194760  ORF Transcript_80334/g.194760 Transcript_80334/m.194760 type:complete len:390 (-) Transcript_80334:508-1677(-)